MTPVQVGIERDNKPVDTVEGAHIAMYELGIDHGHVEAIDPVAGVWLVELADPDVMVLLAEGYVDWGSIDGGPFVMAEMP